MTDSDSPPETATVRVEVSIYMPLSVSPAAVTHTISARRTGAVHTVSATAGSGTYGYATETMPAGHGVRMADNVLHLTEGVDGYLTVTIRVSEAGVGYGGEEATQRVVLRGVAPLSLVTPFPVSPVLEPDLNPSSPVLTVSVGGGLPPYTYSAPEAGGGWFMSGSVVALNNPASEGKVLRGSIVVTDGTDFNRLSVPFTMSFRVTSTLVPAMAGTYEVSPDYTGVVMTLSVSGGSGSRTYRRVSGPSALMVNNSGEVSLATALATEGSSEMAVFEVQDGRGDSGRFTLSLRVAVVEAMYLIGGHSGTPNSHSNQVWRSTNGADWTRIASGPFSGRASHQAVSHDGSLWVIGGDDGAYRNDVWRSADGINWVSVAVSGDVFSTRRLHQVVSYGGSLWVVGGQRSAFRLKNDVWRSKDGVNWVSVAVSGQKFSARYFHQVVSHGGSLWFLGGWDSRNIVENDVWRSADGRTWSRVISSFPRRGAHQAVSHGGNLWVLGGCAPENFVCVDKDDVWRSADGRTWNRVTLATGFSARQGHQLFSYRGSLWVVGGSTAGSTVSSYRNDVWRSADGRSWTQVTGSAAFSRRHYHQVVVHRPFVPAFVREI